MLFYSPSVKETHDLYSVVGADIMSSVNDSYLSGIYYFAYSIYCVARLIFMCTYNYNHIANGCISLYSIAGTEYARL